MAIKGPAAPITAPADSPLTANRNELIVSRAIGATDTARLVDLRPSFVRNRGFQAEYRYAPALPTPFDADDNIDYAVFEKFCGRQIQEGATALVVGGTTGEAPTLTPAEHRTLIRIQIK